MKDVYNPDNEDVMEWVNSSEEKWPASDWDYYVTSCDNDLLIMKLANGLEGSKKMFFVHALYYLVGAYFRSSSRKEEKKKRIDSLLSLAERNASPEVTKWRNETLNLFAGDLEFDLNYWTNYLIYDDL
jgi:hypothetical protein